MSFIDLATLTMHRRTELEARLHVFHEKCDRAVDDINKLKMKTQSFPLELNCEPSELKDRFLNCMKQLDEYMYLITDFNLALSKVDDKPVMEYTPVHDISLKPMLPIAPLPNFNLMDALSEPAPSTSAACSNNCPPEKPKRVKIPKDQTLIEFSSTSSSEETVMKSKLVQEELAEEIKNVKIEETLCNLPAQEMLDTDHSYNATIMHIDGAYFWLITEDPEELHQLVIEMTKFYSKKHKAMSTDEVRSLACCAFYDNESDCYYRGLFLKLLDEDSSMSEIFVVDTGEMREVPVQSVQPLYKQFCVAPPYARCCHLAGVDMMIYTNQSLMQKQEEFMKKYVGTQCSIAVDDNSSESFGVYVLLESGETLNAMIVQEGLALHINAPSDKKETIPEADEIDITQCPEYEDPVEAVTGYSNRDEADICKHYKGGPDKTCFKGTRCHKKHILKHPDGWTLDRVRVTDMIEALPLPAPRTWHRALVTNVCHYDRIYVQLITNDTEELPQFGVVLPPTTLAGLVRDMNSPAARMAYKPLALSPSQGEVVAALYHDNNWYRARVLNVSRSDQCIELMYVDYGTVVWVKEDQVRALEPRFVDLPMQAVRCQLAGVTATTSLSHLWAQAKRALATIALDKKVNLHVIAREYDEIIVEAIDEDGFSIAEKLAATKLVELVEYKVVDDSAVTKKLVVP